MRVKFLLIALLVSMTTMMPAAFANREILAIEQYPLLFSLEDMYWQENLSRNDIRKVEAALESKKYTLGEAAARVVVLHRLSGAISMLRKAVAEYKYSTGDVLQMVVDAFGRGVDPVTFLRAASLDGLSEGRRLNVIEIITSIVVIDEARALRAGLKSEPDIAGLTLSPFQQRLLAYSRMDRAAAVNSLLAVFSKAEVQGRNERDAANILRTFGQDGVDAVLRRLSSATARRDASYHELSLLLYVLQFEVQSMDRDTKQRVRRVISRIDVAKVSGLVNYLRKKLLE